MCAGRRAWFVVLVTESASRESIMGPLRTRTERRALRAGIAASVLLHAAALAFVRIDVAVPGRTEAVRLHAVEAAREEPAVPVPPMARADDTPAAAAASSGGGADGVAGGPGTLPQATAGRPADAAPASLSRLLVRDPLTLAVMAPLELTFEDAAAAPAAESATEPAERSAAGAALAVWTPGGVAGAKRGWAGQPEAGTGGGGVAFGIAVTGGGGRCPVPGRPGGILF
jgi:hypothetical protein